MSTREQKERRNKVLRIGAGTLAFLGIGAAITTAAWTDQVWFSGSASASAVQLEGSTDKADWAVAQDESVAIQIPDEALQNLAPGHAASTVEVYVKNASESPVDLSDATLSFSGDLFADDWQTSAVTATVADGANLQPDDIATVTVAIDPTNIPDALAGTSGNFTVHVSGTTAS